MDARLIAVLGLAACGLNQSGNVASTELGDVSRTAERGSPIETLVSACGAGARTIAGRQIRRTPYLQNVTPTSGVVGWVTTGGGETVTVTTVDGTPVQAAAGRSEVAVTRTANEQQVWAELTGLQPDTVYCYEVTDGAERLIERAGFRTAPTADAQRVRVLAFGDSGGGGSDQHALASWMRAFPYDVIIHTGDVAYDDGTIAELEDNVFGVYADLFRHVPFFPAAGNHDHRTLRGAPFRDVFSLPGAPGETWYAFDWGPVHFVALDTEADYATQVRWLDEDLARSTAPWTIVYLHRPPYSSGNHGSDTALRAHLAPVVERHDVQLVLAGHDHDYERMKPQNGVAYVVTGGGGRGTYPVGTSAFTAFSTEVIHFVLLDIGPDELVLYAVDATGKTFDSLVVPRAQAAR